MYILMIKQNVNNQNSLPGVVNAYKFDVLIFPPISTIH